MDPTSMIIHGAVYGSQALGIFVYGSFVQYLVAHLEESQNITRRLSYKGQPCQRRNLIRVNYTIR